MEISKSELAVASGFPLRELLGVKMGSFRTFWSLFAGVFYLSAPNC